MLLKMNLIKLFSVVLLFVSSTTFAEMVKEDVISKKLTLKANKNKIWSALTNENELSKWWNVGVKLEPFIGGEFYEPWGKEQLATGKVVSLKFQEFIKFTWKEKYWASSQNTVCIFSMKQLEKKMVLKIHHSGWESIKDSDKRKKLIEGFEKGWDLLLPKLKRYLEP